MRPIESDLRLAARLTLDIWITVARCRKLTEGDLTSVTKWPTTILSPKFGRFWKPAQRREDDFIQRNSGTDWRDCIEGTSNNHNFFVGSIVGAAPMILAHNLS